MVWYVPNPHEMNDLVSNRPMRVGHISHELFLGERHDITIPYLAVFAEVIIVEMAKSICIHIEILPRVYGC